MSSLPRKEGAKYELSFEPMEGIEELPDEEYKLVIILANVRGNSAEPEDDYGFHGLLRAAYPNAKKEHEEMMRRGWIREWWTDEEKINTLRTDELKILLEKHGLRKSGKRQELIDRLIENIGMHELAEQITKPRMNFPTDKGCRWISAAYHHCFRMERETYRMINSGHVNEAIITRRAYEDRMPVGSDSVYTKEFADYVNLCYEIGGSPQAWKALWEGIPQLNENEI